MAYPTNITITVGLLDRFRELTEGKDFLSPPKRRKTQAISYGRDNPITICRDMSRVDLLQEKLERLRHVDEVCFDHQAWAVIETETNNFTVARKRYLAAVEKIDRIMVRWAAALPKKEPGT